MVLITSVQANHSNETKSRKIWESALLGEMSVLLVSPTCISFACGKFVIYWKWIKKLKMGNNLSLSYFVGWPQIGTMTALSAYVDDDSSTSAIVRTFLPFSYSLLSREVSPWMGRIVRNAHWGNEVQVHLGSFKIVVITSSDPDHFHWMNECTSFLRHVHSQ